MKKIILIIIGLVVIGASVGAYYMRKGDPPPDIKTAQITRGDIIDAVQATGTLEAVTTVQVGTQVGGIVQELYADFNDIVKKGQVIARLDPSLLQTQIEQQRANVVRSQADLDRLKVGLADARQKLDRAKALFDKQLLPRTELETAEVNVKSQEAQIKSSEAGLTQARSQLNTAEVNLAHTVIDAPIDGIVISRQVEPGQTVNAGMSAPTLFILAADLTKMQVNANIDEADVGRMRPGQVVTFRVDAFPTETFTGAVQQVRLQPTTVQNVVTYQTVISVPNPQMKLKPGMTANVTIEVSRKNNVLRIPSVALRFRPTADMFAALHQEVPPEMQRGPGGAGGRNAQNGRGGAGAPEGTPAAAPGTPGAAPAAAASQPTAQNGGQPNGQRTPRANSAEARGGGDATGGDRASGRGGGGRGGFDPNMSQEDRRKRMEARMAAMSPEERAAFEQRMRDRGQGGGGRGGGFGGRQGGDSANRQSANAQGANQAGGRPDSQRGRIANTPSIMTKATTIDSLFGPLPTVESRGRAWLYMNKQIKMVSLRLGISDGANTEIIEPQDLQTGTEVVTNIVLGNETRPPAGANGASQNPLMGPQRGNQGRGPGGGRGR